MLRLTMTALILAGFAIIGLGLLGNLENKWLRRAEIILPLICLALAVFCGNIPLVLAACLLALSHLRLIMHRYSFKRERRILRRSYLKLFAVAVLSFGLVFIIDYWGWKIESVVGIIILSLAARSAVLAFNRAILGQYRPSQSAESSLPSVSIAIPARNETHALNESLQTATATTYVRLETLVLDDCSQDATPKIIKSFAQSGVRFIQGTQPVERWLGKNQAYQQLLDESSGDYVLFMGVDVHLTPDSLTKLIDTALKTQAKMISVMLYERELDWKSRIARPLRQYWQLAVTPWPLSSSCWLVNRKWLLSQGGFNSFRHKIQPEQFIASLARKDNRGYSFILSNTVLGITTRKKPDSLAETAVRTIYPLSSRELIWLALRSVGLLLMLAVSTYLPIMLDTPLLQIVFLAASLLLWLSAISVEAALQPHNWLKSWWLWPISLLAEIYYSIWSFQAYEFGKVIWKGRNVCVPVLEQSRIRV